MAGVSFGDEPRQGHRLVVTATVQVDIAPDRVVAGQLLDVSVEGAYVSIATTDDVGGLVRLSFTADDGGETCIAYGAVVRWVNHRDSIGVGVRFTQHNPAFLAWLTLVREGSPGRQIEAINGMRNAVVRLR